MAALWSSKDEGDMPIYMVESGWGRPRYKWFTRRARSSATIDFIYVSIYGVVAYMAVLDMLKAEKYCMDVRSFIR